MKTCFKCEEEKILGDFYKHPRMKDGHLNKCKECTKSDVLKHRGENIDRFREYDRKRGKLPHRLKLMTRVTKDMRKRLPHVYKAHTAVKSAIRNGTLVNPGVCSICDKIGKIIGHHEDYSKPLDIEWMCDVCHKQRHKKLKAEHAES
jgi:hypothetical protein